MQTHMRSATTRNALVIIAVVTAGAALAWMQAILTPLALALFLMVMVDGFARFLARHAPALPEWAALPLAIVIMVAVLLGALLIVADNAAGSPPAALARDEMDHAAAVFFRIRDGVESYLWIQTVTGALMAAGSFVAMQALGLQNAMFWAFLIFIASYIPVLGGLVGSVLPPLFALLQFEAYWRALALFAALQAIFFVIGNVVQPRMQRDSLNIDPVMILLSLAFWGAVWGVPGMFLSTPLTVMAIIILAQFEGSRWVAILMSGDGQPEQEPVLKPRRAPVAEAGEPVTQA